MKKISFRETRDLIEIQQMTLEDYKQQVYDYLTMKLGVSTTVAKNRMESYDDFLEEFLEEKYPVSAAATAIMYGF